MINIDKLVHSDKRIGKVIDFISIDTEGHDMQVILGMRGLSYEWMN